MMITMEEEYIELVLELWLESAKKSHPFLSSDYWDKACDRVKKGFFDPFKTFLYQARDGSIQGFVTVAKAEESEYAQRRAEAEGGLITQLFVLPEAQGQGAGTALLNYCKGLYEELWLSVYCENDEAVGYYESQGFTIEKERVNKETEHKEYIMLWSDDRDWCNLLMGMQC